MKKNIIIVICMAGIILSSCKKWLTVEPATLTTSDKLFETATGFADALTGLYINLRGNYAPDQFYMAGGIESMACLWYKIPTSAVAYFQNHDYTNTNADGLLGTAFLNQYKVIANANILLKALETQTVLTNDVAKLMEGEARAVRAFAHFDLIRVWGPMPGNIGNKNYLPYVTTVTTDRYVYESYDSYMKKLSDDLDRAEALLKQVDPILTYTNAALNTTNNTLNGYKELFWYYRQNRFNYYGVLGLQARVKLWLGKKDDAYQYASMVINAVNSNGTKKFTMGTRADIAYAVSNYTFFTEHLVGLNIQKFDDSQLFATVRNASNCNLQTRITGDLYNNGADLRTSMWYSGFSLIAGANVYTPMKYANMTLTTSPSPYSIPLIRLSEMYLILAETAPLAEANTLYTTFRTAREASVIPLEESTRSAVLVKEYTREFYAEGQTFFANKRMGLTTMLWASHAMGEAQYVPPLPTGETNN